MPRRGELRFKGHPHYIRQDISCNPMTSSHFFLAPLGSAAISLGYLSVIYLAI
jgi:hypothetical protein